jgi:hypothetical protein
MVQSFPLTALGVSRVRSRLSLDPIIFFPLLPTAQWEKKMKKEKRKKENRNGKIKIEK